MMPIRTQEVQILDSTERSFVDHLGASVIIPRGEAEHYARVKAEQLRALSQVLSGTATDSIYLRDDAKEILQLMVHEYAVAIEALIGIVARDAGNEATRRQA